MRRSSRCFESSEVLRITVLFIENQEKVLLLCHNRKRNKVVSGKYDVVCRCYGPDETGIFYMNMCEKNIIFIKLSRLLLLKI